jgi:hypothetical protein
MGTRHAAIDLNAIRARSPSSNLSTDLQAATSANTVHPDKGTHTNAGTQRRQYRC